jgi:chemotaxis protein CheZ
MTQAPGRSQARAHPFDRARAYLQEKRDEEASFGDMIALAELTSESMQAFVAAMDRALYRELREISDYITTMRAEIAKLGAGELKSDRLPRAGEHLGAIVASTEEATNTIMEAAEAMLAAEGEDEAAFKALVNEKVMAIFEACSFQDLTGQRIARVVETLEHVEDRIGRFASAAPVREIEATPETERERRARELLLNGPQAKGVAIAQTDVDALLAG